MNLCIRAIARAFPRVKVFETNDLHLCLQGQIDIPILYDVREAGEFNISHIPGAVHVRPSISDDELKAKVLEHCEGCKKIVCYCSVGYRSSQLVDRIQTLLALTDKEVHAFSLSGSIFKWANEGKPLVDVNGSSTKYVHPYSLTAGTLLDRQLWKWK